MNKKAFTLVELIVVITILAILSTVAFISFQGYAKLARDTTRLSDLKSISKVLELYKLTNSKYPKPVSPTNITYLGLVAWTQGIFGETAYTNRSSMSNVPLDPVTGLAYPYSSTANGQEYQTAAVLEDSSSNTFGGDVFAGAQEAKVIVKGNYNGKFLKVKNNTTTYLLGVPSILSSDIVSSTELENLLANEKLVYNGYKNLPASYSGSIYNTNPTDGFNFGAIPYFSDNLTLFMGDINSLKNDSIERVDLLKKLQTAYSGTVIENESDIIEFLNIDSNSSSVASNYIAVALNNTLKTRIPIIANNGNDIICDNIDGLVAGYDSFTLCDNTIGLKYEGVSKNVPYNSTMTSGKRDVYRVQLQAGESYGFYTSAESGSSADTLMYLYDDTGVLIDSNDDGGIGNGQYTSGMNFTSASTAYYYIGIMGFEDTNSGGDFTMNIKVLVDGGIIPPLYCENDYTTGNGLISNNAKAIIQDNNGIIWVGTDLGISKFNGTTWESFTTNEGLPGNDIKFLFKDTSGNIWMHANGVDGVYKYDGTSWITYTVSDGLIDNDIRTAFEDNAGNMWFGSFTGGVSMYNGTTWTSYNDVSGLGSNNVGSITQDGNGDMWFAESSWGGPVTSFDGTTWTVLSEITGDFTGVDVDIYGNLWVYGYDGVFKQINETWRWYTDYDTWDGYYSFGSVGDSLGNMWFGTYDGGLKKYDKNNEVVVNYSTLGDIVSIVEASDGNMWFADNGSGVSMCHY